MFAAPWFAAIYLLLFVSLAGCVVPRADRLARSARALPPRAPRNLSRLPNSARYQTRPEPADEASAAAATFLTTGGTSGWEPGGRLVVGREGVPAGGR